MLALGAAAAAPAALAQGASVPTDGAAILRLNQDVAYSLFVLTASSLSVGGFAKYEDTGFTSKFNVYGLPLRQRFDTGLIGPVELRVALSYGEATTNSLQVSGDPAGPLLSARSVLRTWNARVEIGRPFEIAPDLEFTPLLGLGWSHWTGKSTSAPAGVADAPVARSDSWVDAPLYRAAAILEYRIRLGDLGLRPGAAVDYTHVGSVDGRVTRAAQPGVPASRGPAGLSGSTTILRTGVSLDGPLGVGVGTVGLRWQAFVVGSYEAGPYGLFPWSVEVGAALGADASRFGRSRLGVDPGTLYVGASYIVGDNLSGVRANFGFRF